MDTQTISQHYLDGITEGREAFNRHGLDIASETIDTLDRLCRQFSPDNPVGQLFRGERDFWRHQIRKATR